MNLTSDPWIPIVWEDGRAAQVSLADAFQRGHEIRDLAVRPHERIALMRLLICVAQAALDGPKDRADWRTCAARLPAAAAAYLERWRYAFELFGDGQRFLQVADVLPTRQDNEDASLASKLDVQLATGSASTLFDNAGGSTRGFSPEMQAVMLLTFQCFSPGGLLSECMWAGVRTRKAGNKSAPGLAGRMAHTVLLDRGSLAASVCLNLLTKEQLAMMGVPWGQPVWERMPSSPGDGPAVENATATYLGRQVSVSRAVRLSVDGISVVWGGGLDYPSFADTGWRDPAGTVYLRQTPDGTKEPTQLAASIDRSLWRELHALAAVGKATDSKYAVGGPMALQNAAGDKEFDLYVAGLVYDSTKTASLLDVVESTFHLPAGMFAEAGQKRYQDGVQQAERYATRLGRAISAYHGELKDELDGQFWKHGAKVKQKAASHFWTAVEQRLSELLAVVEEPGLLHPGGAAEPTWSHTAWGKAVSAAARAAYELACPHQTPRQMKAYTVGLKALFHEPAAANATAEAETEEEAS